MSAVLQHRAGWALAGLITVFSAAAQPPFSLALVGDYNYGPLGGPEWQASARMIAAINASDVRFTVHLGDIKSGATECADTVVAATRAQFGQYLKPLVYLFGDNEWTDCHRYAATDPASPYTQPLERLAHLRQVFYTEPWAQGGERLRLQRQADIASRPEFRGFVEQVRWEFDGVVFLGLNVPGSNNNYSGGSASPQTVKVAGQDQEWGVRTAAAIAWLREGFRYARQRQARAVMVCWQANPDLENLRPELPHYDSNGFHAVVDVLRGQAAAFPGPVVLAHGDSHHGFRVDRPFPNLIRVENYGDPHTHWTKITILPGQGPEIFRFEGMKVEGNP